VVAPIPLYNRGVFLVAFGLESLRDLRIASNWRMPGLGRIVILLGKSPSPPIRGLTWPEFAKIENFEPVLRLPGRKNLGLFRRDFHPHRLILHGSKKR